MARFNLGFGPGELSWRNSGRVAGVAAVALSAVALTACGSSSDSSSASTSGGDGSGRSLDKVTFLTNVPTESLTFTPELVATQCGQFADHGLDVDLQYINGSPAAIQIVLQNRALLTRPGDVDTMQAIADQGAPIVNVGTVQKGGPTLRVISSTKEPLEKPADFVGKTMGVASAGGATKAALDLIMTNNGNRPEQLSRQVVGLTPAIFQLVKQGKLDGYVVSLDTAVALDQQDPEAVVFDPGTTMNAGTSNYITSETQARDPKKADQIRRYLASIDEAMRFVIADRADGYRRTIDCISKGFRVATFATPEVARAALDGYVDAWTVDGEDKMLVTQPADWRAAYDEAAKAGLVRSGQDPTTWLSSDFEPRAGS